ncbi:hypothetical protein HHJ81_05800 [Mobiluncus mulieris]|nr:hypothetical protein [Mobiluncus mulieris]PNL44434.1 hypothetical protein CEP82_011020 [Mobiluncus mulieris]
MGFMRCQPKSRLFSVSAHLWRKTHFQDSEKLTFRIAKNSLSKQRNFHLVSIFPDKPLMKREKMLSPKPYRDRLIDAQIVDLLEQFDAVCVQGPKWCGKTWSSLNQAASVTYMQDPSGGFANRNLARIDPKFVLEGELPHRLARCPRTLGCGALPSRPKPGERPVSTDWFFHSDPKRCAAQWGGAHCHPEHRISHSEPRF